MQIRDSSIRLNDDCISTILYLKNHDEMTNSNSNLYKMRFSTIIWYLRNRGIVEGNGFDENNHKKWRLTEKGKKLAESLVDMKNLMETS